MCSRNTHFQIHPSTTFRDNHFQFRRVYLVDCIDGNASFQISIVRHGHRYHPLVVLTSINRKHDRQNVFKVSGDIN
jgi:hypothetical protein